MNKGYFIAVEGCDYAGKSTLVGKLEKLLKKAGHDVLVVRQPGGTELAEELRDTVKRPRDYEVSSVTEYLIMMAARSDLVHSVIKPALEAGKVVIGDRHDGSTYAYQDMVIPEVSAVASIEPDLTVFLDKRPADLEASIAERGEECRIEQRGLQFQHDVYSRYQDFLAIRDCPVIRIDVNSGYDTPDYDIGLEGICDLVVNTDKHLRSLYGHSGLKQFAEAVHENANIGIIAIGGCVGLIPRYDDICITSDSTDEEVEDYIEYHLGSGHKWKRGGRPVLPLAMNTPKTTATGIKDTSVA